MTLIVGTFSLHVVTAIAEIVARYLTLSFVKQPGRRWLRPVAMRCMVAPTLVRLWLIEGFRPDRWGTVGGATCMVGMGVICLGHRP